MSGALTTPNDLARHDTERNSTEQLSEAKKRVKKESSASYRKHVDEVNRTRDSDIARALMARI